MKHTAEGEIKWEHGSIKIEVFSFELGSGDSMSIHDKFFICYKDSFVLLQ